MLTTFTFRRSNHCALLQKNRWQDLGGSCSIATENFTTKNLARRMTKKNFLAGTKSDAVVTQSAKDTKRAHLRSAHPGFVWTRLHEEAWRVRVLPEDKKVTDISIEEIAALLIDHTKTQIAAEDHGEDPCTARKREGPQHLHQRSGYIGRRAYQPCTDKEDLRKASMHDLEQDVAEAAASRLHPPHPDRSSGHSGQREAESRGLIDRP